MGIETLLIGGLIAGGIGSGVGGAMQAGAARDGATLQAEAAREANAIQREMFGFQKDVYEKQRDDAEPWRATGLKALAGLEDPEFQKDFGKEFEFNFEADPGYQFRMNEGAKAIERSAAARGGLNSGRTMKALANYGQGLASQEYGNAYNRAFGEYNNAYNRFNADRDRRFGRLSSLAGVGQAAQAGLNQAGQTLGNQAGAYGAQAGNTAMGNANAQAAAGMAQANAWGNTLSSIGQLPMQAAMIKSMGT